MDELRKILRESKNKTYGTRLDGKGVESWVNSVNDLGTRAYNYLTSEGYKKPDEELIKEIDSYLANHKDIDHYLRTNKAFYEDYDKAYQSYIDTVNNLRNLRNNLQSSNRVYSQWTNKGEYNTWYKDYLKQQEEQKKYLEMINSEEASTGWQKYLDDVENAKKTEAQEKEDMAWWERLLSYLPEGGVNDTSVPLGNMPQIVHELRKDTSYKTPNDNWSDKQRKQFGYLYLTDPNKASEYAIAVNDYNNKLAEEEALQDIAKASTLGFWAGFGNTVGAILTAPLGMADYLNDLAMANAGRPITSDGIISPFEYSQGVTSGISTHLNNKYGTIDEDIPIFGGKGVGDIYSVGTSIAQSLVSAYTLGGGGTLISYFGQGAASGVDDALSRGATDGQAILYGTMLGAFEGLAEQFSVEKLLKAGSSATFKGFFKNVFNQMVAEGQEEGLTSLASNIADQWIMRDKSNFSIIVAQYIDQGMSESEAIKKACLDTLGDIAFDTITGAVSGGVSGGIHTTAQTIGANINAKEMYGSGADLVATAHEIGGDAGLLADKYQGRLDSGKNLTGGQINRLVETNESTMRSQDTEKIKSATEARLTKLGETGDVSALADIIVKAQTGGKLTHSERQTLINSKYGRRVSNELNVGNIKSGEYSSAWAEEIGTDKINVEAYNKGVDDIAPPKVYSSDVGSGENVPAMRNTVADSKSIVGENTASESGVDTVNGKEVSIKEIASIKNGVVTLKLDNGESVNASDVEFGSTAKGLLYESVVDMGLNAESANVFVRGYDPGEGLSVENYILGFKEAYRYGEYGFPVQEMSRKGFSVSLSEEKRSLAYGLGKTDSKFKTGATQNAIHNAKVSNKVDDGTMSVDEAMTEKGLTHRQKSSLKGLKAMTDALGVNIRIFKSAVGEDGKRIGENGRYDTKTGILYVDLYAGLNGEGTILYTAAHELTHFIRQWSPSKFKIFADFLLEEYGKKGISVDALVRNQIAKTKRNGRDIDFDTAYEEVVADSCESFLSDGNAIEKIAKLKAKDKGLWQKIKDFITKLVAKIKAAYEGLSPDSIEGRFVSEMLDTAERLKELWTEALVDASEIYATAEKTLGDNGIMVDSKTESASLMSVRDLLESKEAQKVAETLAKRFDVTVEEARNWISAETSLASLILNPKYSQYLDYTADASEEAIKSNSDYPQGTVDFSNICKKRRDFTEVMNRVLRNFPNHVFEATDLAKIRTIMSEEGMEVACGICYVEDRRQLDSIVAQDFIESLSIYRQGGKTRPDGKPFNTNQLKAFKLIEGDNYTPSIYELISLEGRNVLKAKNPAMDEAWVKFNNARGMQSVRLLLNDAEYKRQILSYKPATVQRKNDLGGLRIYSFSDMEMFHLIDIIQVITDSATVGLSLQGYTKVNEYAKAVKDTGEKLNRSLIPKGDLGYHIEEGRVVLDFDTVEGIDINHPDFFDNIDNPNVGNIVIGINKKQIQAAMTSKFIDQIIPFHTGQSNEVLGEKGIASWVNYKDAQTEKDLSTGRTSKHQINIYTEVIQAAEAEGKPITNKVEFVNEFLEVCKENNLEPRFSEFLNVDENGNYVYTEGYHKFLVDFKTFDQNTGEYLPQMPVKPIFDNAYMTKLLKDYVKTQKTKDAQLADTMPKVLERITKEIVNPRKGVKLSGRDSVGNTLSDEQAEFFKDSKVRNADGNLLVLYHGTTKGGFTVFDPNYSDDNTSLFFTSSKKTAQSYGISKKVFNEQDFEIRPPIKTVDEAKAFFDSISWKVIELQDGKGWDGKTQVSHWNKNTKFLLRNHQGFPKGSFLTEQSLIDSAEKNAQETDSQKVNAGMYEVYLNLTHPLIVDAKGHSWNQINFVPPELERNIESQEENLRRMGVKRKELKVYAQEHGITLSEAMDRDAEYAKLYDEGIELEEEYESFVRENGLDGDINTRAISKYAKRHGYDGVIFKNIYDAGQFDIFGDTGMAEYIAVAFNSNQVKATTNKNPTSNPDIRYSVREIVGDSGTNYGTGVYLDSTLLTDLTEDERIDMVKEYVKELGGSVFTAYDNNHKAVDVHIAEASQKFKNKNGKRVPVNKDLTGYLGKSIKQESIALVDELILTSKLNAQEPSSYSHDWLDNYGKNDWEYWVTYVQDKENTIWEATLNIATTANGEKILYDIVPIKKVEQSVTSDTSTTDDRIPQSDGFVKGVEEKNSLRDIEPSRDTEAVELSDVNTKYSVRDTDPPEKTIKGYKVFYVKNGKLYPPMVANPNGEGTPVGVWLDADDGQLAYNKDGTVKTNSFGRPRVKAGGKGTQGGSGDLAYRPGWHLGDLPMAKQFARADSDGNKTLFPATFVWAECEVAADVEYQAEADAMGYKFSKNGKFNHQQASLDHMPRETDGTAGFYRYRTNPDPTTEAWIITGAMKVNRLLTDEEVASILEESGRTPMPRQGGKLDLAKLGLTEADFNAKYSDRDYEGENISNRTLLANALESVAKNEIEKNKLSEYKKKIELIDTEQTKLTEIKAEIKKLSFAKGTKDTARIKQLQFEANQTANRINTYDKQLLNLESTSALKGVLEREKQMAYKRAEQRGKENLAKQKEKDAETVRRLMTRYQESRQKGIESRSKTALRHKIKDVVNELNQYLLKGTKDRHVPIELQLSVAEALEAVNMDTVGAEERIAKLKEELVKAKTPEKIQEIAKKIEHIQEMGDRMDSKLKALKDAYDMFVESDDPLIANSHDEVISNSIAKVIKDVGSTPIRNMTLTQLEEVYNLYRMVLTSVRNANKAFKAKKSESIAILGNRVMEEVEKVGGKTKLRSKARQTIENFNWNNQKPIYAFERIGSDTFTEVYKNVRAGEDTWAVDMEEAKRFRIEQYQKHKYDSWDFDKRWKFTSTSDMDFELSLDQIMSLYAYSKREQAEEHLRRGGIVFDPKTEVVEKTKAGIKVKYNLSEATSYNLSDETLADIISKLTPEQKAFVDEMQAYLSDVMGEKGNEVSLELYGIKMFKEKNYFPLKSATQFMERAKEQVQGEAKIKNKGFTKETAPKASNPIVLTSFMDVWTDHVNEMSMYHAFVLPMEDFYRVYNYKTPTSDTMATESVNMYIQNAYGEAAIKYIDQLLKDLNGGARTDPREGIGKSLITNFKKASVLASLSVVVQQPTAIVRAMALVDARHFGIAPISRGIVRTVNAKKHKALWSEVKKYAPVAIIKEMGYFDTNMGQSSKDFLLAKEYHGIGEKAKALVTDSNYRDEKLMRLPALADEMAWVTIWEAVKRETVAKHKDLNPKSEEFLKVVGERFTEVVTKTQVYDSVLSRSGFMRSKSALVNMWTSFMGEPTTSLNMIQDAILKGRRGNKKYMVKAFSGVLGSIILNSALVSLVYALRDDDEDETYIEKYFARLSTELIDGINPLTYIPFVKDIWSIAQGFDVERADMTLITDLVDSLQQTIKVMAKDTEGMDEEELAEYEKQVADSLWSIADTISSFFGLPVKNIRRDVVGIGNLFNTLSKDANERDTSFGSLWDEIWEDVKDSIPVVGWLPDESKTDKLYDAIISGDSAYMERFKSGYKDDKAYNSALSKALRENDSRIREAAQARIDGDIAEYIRIAKQIIAEGNFSQDVVVGAVNAEINAINKGETNTSSSSKTKSLYKIEDYFAALVGRDEASAYVVKEDIIKTDVANGKTEDEAERSFTNKFTNHLKEQYEEGEIDPWDARDMLVEYGGKTEDEAESKVQYWEFSIKHTNYDLSESAVAKYYDEIEPSGISIGVYYDYTVQRAKCEGIDSDGDGRADSGTVKAEVMQVINSLPLTTKQKDALYFANGWSRSTLYEAPWH